MKRRKTLNDFIVQKVPKPYRPLLNKYILTALIFTVWILFFAKANFIAQIRLNNTLDNLKAQKQYYEENIELVKEQKKELFTTDENFEKFAREQHLMKRNNEDIFIINEE